MSVPTEHSGSSDLTTSTSSWVMVDEKEKDSGPGKDKMEQTNELEKNETENEEIKKPRKFVEDVEEEWWNDSDGISVITDPESAHNTDGESSNEPKPDIEVTFSFPKSSIANTQSKPTLKKSTNFIVAVSIIIGSFLIALYFNGEYIDDFEEESAYIQSTCNYEASKSRSDYIRNEENKYSTNFNKNKLNARVERSVQRESEVSYPKNKYNTIRNDKYNNDNEEKEYLNDRKTTVYTYKNQEKSKNSPENESRNELIKRDDTKRKGNFDDDHIKEYKDKKSGNKQFDEQKSKKKQKLHPDDLEQVKEYLIKKEKYLKHKEEQIKQKELKLYAKINEKQEHKSDKKFDYKNNKFNKTTTDDWYNKMHKERNKLRKNAQVSEWVFDRSQMRNKKRDKAYWYFEWMGDREDVRYKKNIHK